MLLIQETSGATLDSVLHNLPHDTGAIIVYLLVIAFIGFIWYGSRKPPIVDEAREQSGD